ncbi:uncharacterized protein LOC121265365 isoform X2 [Juglans microcarpa x Juglans regia]|uniref:uncharacterized protein LOC121265365 isoform X2 n=1 Tax=Juglans microcarpa x Juglans regia TaxID=2249226 RepID=UPI001B7E45B4|nr:uncharacterized protein LOC121265365 isoform X2 [Juglans microcarpa x Juglans regia]
MDQPNEDQEEPPIAELLGVKKKKKKNKNKTGVSSPRMRTTTGVKANKKKGGPAVVDSAAQYPTGSAEDCCDAPKVTVLKFDNSAENHFRAIDAISQLCGELKDGALEEQEIQQLSSSITFLRFASAVGSIERKDVVSGIELPQLSSAAVPKNEEPSGGAATHAESSGSGCSKDFVIHVGGHVWALDWCPRVHESPECPIKCEFVAVATHPPRSSYHKIGAPLTGRGVVQIWGLLNVSMNEDEVPPPAEKPKRGPKNSRDMKDKSTVSKRPRGRPRKKPEEDNVAITTQKRPRGRPRKNLIEKSPDNLDCSEQCVQALAVQFPEDSSDFLAIDGVLGDTQEHAIQEDSGKKQKSYKQAASKCNPTLETPLKCRRLKNKKRTRSCSDDTSPLLLELIEDMGSSVVNQIQAEPAANVNFSHNDSLEISSADCLIPNDVALPRVVFCLAHNGKVAWDAKWRPSDACDSIKMGYLAVLLGNGSLEVWDVPLPRTVKVIYSSDHPEGTDPRFVKLDPVFRCSMLKGGGTQSIPLTVEWSASPPHDLILAGCHDGTVALWKFSASNSSKDTRPLLCFSADTVPIRALAWAPVESDPESANVILTAGHGGLKFWDLRDPFRPLWDLHPVPRIIYSLDWLPDPRCVILSFDDGTMRTLSLLKAAYDVPVTGKPFGGTKQQGLHSYYCSSFAIWSVQVSRLTGMVAYCSADGTVLRFQLTSKAVDKDHSRNRTPHFLCGSLTEEESAITINTPVPNSPFPLKKSLNKSGDTPVSMREFSLEPRVKTASDKVANGPSTDAQTLALCYGDDPSTESGPVEALRHPKSKKRPKKSSSEKIPADGQALVCRDEEPPKTQRKEHVKVEARAIEAFPPKIVAVHRVRWNMNKGSERWLCYGGAAGVVRCQEIVLSDVDKKLTMKR